MVKNIYIYTFLPYSPTPRTHLLAEYTISCISTIVKPNLDNFNDKIISELLCKIFQTGHFH